jgi:branched-chain amino acid transport system substrate-binding protein
VVFLWLGICAQTPCQAEEPLKIGASLGLSGRFGVIAQALHNGFRLWEQNVNDGSGILGRSVKVIIKDDHSDPQQAVAIYRDLIEKERVDFFFAPYSSMITDAVLPVAEAHDIPMLIAGAAADRLWEQGYRNAIGIYTPASNFTLGFLELMVVNDLNRIVVVHADDLFSVSIAESIKKWAPRFQLSILDVVSFRKGT